MTLFLQGRLPGIVSMPMPGFCFLFGWPASRSGIASQPGLQAAPVLACGEAVFLRRIGPRRWIKPPDRPGNGLIDVMLNVGAPQQSKKFRRVRVPDNL